MLRQTFHLNQLAVRKAHDGSRFVHMDEKKSAKEIGIGQGRLREIVGGRGTYERETFVKLGRAYKVPWASLVGEAAFVDQSSATIRGILKVAATLIGRSLNVPLRVRSFCHCYCCYEGEYLMPIASFVGQRANSDAALWVPCPAKKRRNQKEYVIAKAFCQRKFVCENAQWDPKEADGDDGLVESELKAVAAHPIVLIEGSHTDEPLGTVCFDADLTIEELNWVNNNERAFLESTLAELAHIVHRILSPPKRRKSNANGKS